MADRRATRRLLLPLLIAASTPAIAQPEQPASAYFRLPLRFERETTGDAPRFVARGSDYVLAVDGNGAAIALKDSTGRVAQVAIRLAGRSAETTVAAGRQLPGITNRLLGNDPARWATGIRAYAEVECRKVYPGVDVVYYGNQRKLEYDFRIAPGADPSSITMAFEGATSLAVDPDGNLIISTDVGNLVQHAPYIYQTTSDGQRTIDGGYVLGDGGHVAFRVGDYNRALPLVIDPILTYSTYLGGSKQERGNDVAIDAQGNVIVVGETFSSSEGLGDVFVIKFNPAGDALVYATYLGGANYDLARGVTVDQTGNAYVVGQTYSFDFPLQQALQPALRGLSDAFVAKLNPSGSVMYSTFIGGANEDNATGVAADGAGRAHVIGATYSADFPTVSPLQPSLAGNPAFRSIDGGAAWIGLGAGLKTTSVRMFAFDRSTMYAGTEEGVFKSVDGGNTWAHPGSAGLPAARINALAVGSGSPAALFAATDAGLFRSDDRGENWQDLHLAAAITSVVLTGGAFPALYAAAGSAVGQSLDGGATWTDTGLSSQVNGLSASGATVYAATATGVYKLVSGGAWTPANDPSFGDVTTIAVDPSNADIAYAALPGGLFKTTNGGALWTALAQLTGVQIGAIAIAASEPATLYISTLGFGIGLSRDGGQTWYPTAAVNALAAGIAVDPSNPAVVYVTNSLTWDAFVTVVSADGSGLEYSTYFGGSGVEVGTGIALDSQGASYIVGETSSDDFPTVNAIQPARGGLNDVFVAKLSPAGSAVAYATYLGSFGAEYAGRIAVDAAGRAYVTGLTWSSNFPVFNAQQPTRGGGGSDVFVAALNETGTALVYSTYLGGSGMENDSSQSLGPDIAVSPSGDAYVTGTTMSPNFPVTADALPAAGARGTTDGFVTKFDAAGALQYSTLVGGSGADYPRGIAVDAANIAVIVGWTDSADLPMNHAVQPAYGGSEDAFVIKMAPGSAPTIDSLIARLNAYAAQGAVTGGTYRGLLSKLNDAKDAYARGKLNIVRARLRDFISQCSSASNITPDAAAALTADAEYLVRAL